MSSWHRASWRRGFVNDLKCDSVWYVPFTDTPRVARKMRRAVGLSERDGLLVRGVEDESPAGGAGIQRGDLIVAAAGDDVDGIDALHRSLETAAGADRVDDAVLRRIAEAAVEVGIDDAPRLARAAVDAGIVT